ncbi:MAG TPA: glucose-6-phosphate dehydrogenase assembly protein OpcA [Thermoleophilaceae bacterium]|jgi:glucose-6-phosphate dehydrogenase assembly protein OpcA|nr:glucose-6-phosphate dehydrogenase assembly protein OpcA [Thermoleophilaceae bacterium]
MSTAAQIEGVWSEQDTTPGAVEAALRNLLVQAHTEEHGYVPARVLNTIIVVDRQFKGEIANRLERVGRYHPSRTILVAVEPRRTTMDAHVQIAVEHADGGITVGSESVEIDIGPKHLPALDTMVDPLLVPDLTTLAWAPHGHDQAIDALRRLVTVVLIDSAQQLNATEAIKRAADVGKDAYIVDLAWLRSTPWRERIAATFDPAAWRPSLREIAGISVTAREDSVVAGVLLLGWLACRLGWSASELIKQDGVYMGTAHGRRQDVKIKLYAQADLGVPGLSGVQIETASGTKLTLDRGPGGLQAKRITRDGKESSWVVLGASRGESGILGEGIRQALLRDPTYRPALDCARMFLGSV